MGAKWRVFLDSSALFAAIHSETGGARLILKLGEAGAVSLWVGPWVLKETEAVMARKSPRSRAYFALLLDRAQVQVGEKADADALGRALSVLDYPPDAQVLAEALAIEIDYFVSFDRKHLVGNPQAAQIPFPIGTAGDFLSWYREQVTERLTGLVP